MISNLSYLLTLFHGGKKVLDWHCGQDAVSSEYKPENLPGPFVIESNDSEGYFFGMLGRFLGQPFDYLPLDEIALHRYSLKRM